MPPSSTCVLLLRHGETLWNRDRKFQGQADIELTDLGIAQAREAIASLQQLPIAHIYSSTLQRASKTAEIIGDALGIEPVFDERLREINVGSLMGKTWDEVQALDVDHESLIATGCDFRRGETGETEREVADRMCEAIEEIIARHAGQTVLVVSHGLAIRVALPLLLGWDFTTRTNLGTMGNCRWATLVEKGSRRYLDAFDAY